MENVDRISDLHDSILSHILSFLPTKEAVGTSVLSSRWRYLFTLVSNLDFQLHDFPRSYHVESFISFVDRMMFLHKTRADRFRLQCPRRVESSRVWGWISDAATGGVKHLDLNISLHQCTLPGALFTCGALVTLKLHMSLCYFVLNIPDHLCLPNLKTLHIKQIVFPDDASVKSLVSGCIRLEDLVLENCSTYKDIVISHDLLKRLTILHTYRFTSSLVIDAPALAYFKYVDRIAGHIAGGYSLRNLESLVEADIDLTLKHENEAISVIKGINNAKSLNLSFTSLKPYNCFEPLPIFPNLVRLKIYDDSQEYYYERGLAKFLSNSNGLEELAFNQDVLCPLPETVPPCVLFKLKVIEISGFLLLGDVCFRKAKYFLENARELKKLTIRTLICVSEEERVKLFKELSALPRQAKDCCISIV